MKPLTLYDLTLDKQRVVLTGETNILVSLITHVLKSQQRKFDYANDTEIISSVPHAPVVIISSQKATAHHPHIAVAPSADSDPAVFEHLPKGGIIIYNKEIAPLAKAAEVERTDVQAIGITYESIDYEMKHIIRKYTKEEKMTIATARELLKKLGITPAQFEESLSTFTFNKS